MIPVSYNDVTNFIDFDFDSFLGHFLLCYYSSLNRYNSGTIKDLEKQ